MDYHVFILSRIREGYDRGLSTDKAISHGIRATAGTVTSAAFVMVGVFLVFVTLPLVDLKEMGIGLALAVLIDATLVRGVLLPATMKLLGEANWYLPSWLKWLPRHAAARARSARSPSPPATSPIVPSTGPGLAPARPGPDPFPATPKGPSRDPLLRSTHHRHRHHRRSARKVLRRSPGRHRRQLHRATRNDRRFPRPQWRRQDHDAPGAARPRRAYVRHARSSAPPAIATCPTRAASSAPCSTRTSGIPDEPRSVISRSSLARWAFRDRASTRCSNRSA